MERHRAVKVDVLAEEVSRRLAGLDPAQVLDDPQGHLLRIAAEVRTEWEGRARRSRNDRSTDAFPAPSASDSNRLRAAVLALQQRPRNLLLLHLDGLTYREIAEKTSLSCEAVLQDLVRAYGSLRSELDEDDYDVGPEE